MTIRYKVTFEFETKPPLTFQSTVSATNIGTCASRAFKAAKAALGKQDWSSTVFVALERLPEPVENGPSES